jgi:hypothetical protein
MRKLFTRESSQQAKGNLCGVFFLVLQEFKLGRKIKKKREIFLNFRKVFQTHKKKARK